MPTMFESLDLEDASRAIRAAAAKADTFGVACSIAVVDAGGHLLAFARQDGAMIGSAELAIGKAFTARIFNNSSEALGVLAQPGADLFGIQHSHGGRTVIFGGGLPVRSNGIIVGAIGVSGGSVAQDVEIGHSALSSVVGAQNLDQATGTSETCDYGDTGSLGPV